MTVSRCIMTDKNLLISKVIAGFWRINEWGMSTKELQCFIGKLLDMGITTMDHAFVYKSEAPFGAALKADPSLRAKMEIISKFGIRPTRFGPLGANSTNHYDSTLQHLNNSVNNTLQDLNTDYLDVLLVHRPDYLMDAEKLASGFDSLIQSGKVKHIGVSNFTPSQFTLLQSKCKTQLVTNQIEFSPLHLKPLDDGTLDQAQTQAFNPMFWSCLAGGRLTTEHTPTAMRIRKTLHNIQEQIGVNSIEQIIYAWLFKHPSNGFAIVGSKNIKRISLAASAESIQLSHEHWYAIWEAAKGHPVP